MLAGTVTGDRKPAAAAAGFRRELTAKYGPAAAAVERSSERPFNDVGLGHGLAESSVHDVDVACGAAVWYGTNPFCCAKRPAAAVAALPAAGWFVVCRTDDRIRSKLSSDCDSATTA